MEKIKKYMIARFFSLALLFILLCAFQDGTPAEPFHLTWKLIIPIVLGLYDVIVRFIPTVKDLSWLSWIVKLLNFLNEFLNRKKKR
jgi:hypothetical protein